MNAIHDPWLPVRFPDGTTREVGLREALVQAHAIEGLADPRPLGPPTQLRLLVALAQRVFAPEDARDWRALWRAGRFDAAPLDAYFGQWERRFELLDAETPFLQVGGDFRISGNEQSIDKLSHDVDPADYNRLFSHSDASVMAVPLAEALRRVVMVQACGIHGGKTSNPSWNGKEFVRPYFADAPLATTAIITLEGSNLFEMVLLNLVPEAVPDDLPSWEQALSESYFHRSTADGPLDRLTNLSRMVRLILDQGGMTISKCYYTQGRALSESAADTMVSYHISTSHGILAHKVNIERACWRDLHALLAHGTTNEGNDLRARVLQFVGSRVAEGDLSFEHRFKLRVTGVANSKAKILLWRGDRLNLPAALLVREDLVALLGARMSDASDVAQEIGRRTRSMCWHYLAPVRDQMAPDTANVNNLADQLDARQIYWSRLEVHFPGLLDQLAVLPDVEPETIAPLSAWWAALCAAAARDALEASQDRLGETPRAWRAVAAVSTNFQPKERVYGS